MLVRQLPGLVYVHGHGNGKFKSAVTRGCKCKSYAVPF